jgi:hypothetical protein
VAVGTPFPGVPMRDGLKAVPYLKAARAVE